MCYAIVIDIKAQVTIVQIIHASSRIAIILQWDESGKASWRERSLQRQVGNRVSPPREESSVLQMVFRTFIALAF